MSETPQTPPPSEPPPPSGSGRPASSMNADQMKAAVQGANQYDLGIIAAGVLVFLLSLFPGYYTFDVGAVDGSYNAWHGFFGWFAAVLALAGAGLLAARLFANVSLPFPTRLTVLGLFGAALLFVIIAGLTWAGQDTGGVDIGKYTGHGFTYWLSLILIIAGGALAFMRKDAND
jgi:hypothetical protein